MVVYDLQCAAGHRFEGWFPNAKEYEIQLTHGAINCSVCGSSFVEKLPSGGHFALHTMPVAKGPQKTPQKTITAEQMKKSGKEIHTNIDPITLMKAVHHYVKKNFKDVGDKFADHAIEIHKGEKEPEPIYGTANTEQKEKMEDEGVPYTTIPDLPEEFEN